MMLLTRKIYVRREEDVTLISTLQSLKALTFHLYELKPFSSAGGSALSPIVGLLANECTNKRTIARGEGGGARALFGNRKCCTVEVALPCVALHPVVALFAVFGSPRILHNPVWYRLVLGAGTHQQGCVVDALAGAVGDDPTFVPEKTGGIHTDVARPHINQQLQNIILVGNRGVACGDVTLDARLCRDDP
jgi:hypothetical protein